jgi:hypothetical protein
MKGAIRPLQPLLHLVMITTAMKVATLKEAVVAEEAVVA